MYSITGQQIDFILADINAHGIQLESLQYDLLDHICIIIEQSLEKEEDFEKLYAATIQRFYKQELREIEEETIYLLTYRKHLTFSRNQFFLLLFTLLIGPFIAYDIDWLFTNGRTAGWKLPISIWGATLVYSLFPLLILIVLFLTPERLDPPIPKKAKILLGSKPLIKIIRCDDTGPAGSHIPS